MMDENTDLAILKARAKQLAQERTHEEEDGESIEVTVFSVAKKLYAVELRYIEEVLPVGNITPLPGAPNYILGILNIRGRIVALNDLKPIFGLSDEAGGQPNHGVVVVDGEMELALAADELVGVTTLKQLHLIPPPPTMTPDQKLFIRGVTQNHLIVLDAAAMLASKALIVNQKE